VIGQYLPEPLSNYRFLRLDLNSIPVLTMTTFYRSMLYKLEEALEDHPELGPTMHNLMNRLTNLDDALGLYLTLERAHHLLIHRAGKRVVWLLDRFDEGCKRLEADTLNSLRNLRDQFKEKLIYVAFTRFPLARLRNPAEIDEFHEIMIIHTCWVGPMSRSDADWVAQQVCMRHQGQIVFSESAKQIVYQLCGGWPAFLKVTYSALADGILHQQESPQCWLEKLLTLEAIQRNCQELWDSCTAEEQRALAMLTWHGQAASTEAKAVASLKQFGLLAQTARTAPVHIAIPIFAEFVRRQPQQLRVGIELVDGTVYRDGLPLAKQPAPLEMNLLAYFLAHAGKLCSHGDIAAHLYPATEPYPKQPDKGDLERLIQVVKRLRETIQADQPWTYIRNERGRGYRFVQPDGQAEAREIAPGSD
jgi:DNA-binding winged helix-turn-helix (wHTH) protein